ncbi:MAG: urea transporter, partial [Planctomycetota bacterium]|nr:urea transporter [Planctomycetota bacterium]
MTDRIKSIFAGCAEILFLQGAAFGAVLVALICLNPRLALFGLLVVLAAYGLAWFLGMEQTFRESGFYVYNALFVGLSLGYRLTLTPQTFLFALAAGAFTLIATILLAQVLVSGLKLPVLSLPFALTSWCAYLTAAKYSGVLLSADPTQAIASIDPDLPFWLAGFFKSFGSILFAPSVVVGMLFSLLVLSYSRILFALAAVGYFAGTLIRTLMLSSVDLAFLDANNFNFILIAMAVGGVFLVPSMQSCLLALLAVAVSPLVLEPAVYCGSVFGLPPFTLPFCVVTLGVVYALRVVQYPLLSTGLGRTPEEIRENTLVNRLRYPGSPRTLYLPFSGPWMVWQGFHGRWTHQGQGCYAYDFVVTDEHGQTHRGDGSQLENYYCYRLPVLAPVSGRVVRVIDRLPDNRVGTVSGGSNWGNLVILHDVRGFYVELSHFAPDSMRVKEGQWVERGAVLGACGNSGFSPQPHIHVQVQATEGVGAATLPFSF